MSVLEAPPLVIPRREWTREEFYRLGDLGFFQGQRVELLEGEIVVQSPQNWPHSSSVTRIYRILQAIYEPGDWVRMQLPLSLGLKSDPEPDVSVVPGRFEDYSAHPTAAIHVVEVADTTLATDRRIKPHLYAAARIPEYWIVDLAHQQLLVLRNPVASANALYGAMYADELIRDATASIAPLARPDQLVRVADLL